MVPPLERNGKIARPFLGVTTTDVTDELARRLNLGVKDGALVTATVDGGPAQRAGIRPAGPSGRGGDVIVAINGEAISNPSQVADRIESLKPGDQARIEVLRGKERKTVTVTLANRPSRPVTP